MKKYIIVLMTFVLIFSVSAVPAFATYEEWDHSDRVNYLVEDWGNMLNEDDLVSLEEKLNEISMRNKCEVAVITVPSEEYILDGYSDIQSAADDLYDFFEYGFGENDDGLLLLITPEKRHITTYGFAIEAFTDEGLAYLANELKPIFENGDYKEGIDLFADECDRFLQKARNGKPYTSWTLKPLGVRIGMTAAIALAIGLIISAIIMFVMKSSMKSVRFQGQADFYVKDGSLVLHSEKDHFLGTNVSRIKKPDPDSGSSSTHTSSSGRSHGGISF